MKAMLFALFVVALTTSCASITRGTNEAYAVQTSPGGATVSITHAGGYEQCTSPCSVQVKRKGMLMIEIVKDGYQDFMTTIQSAIDGAGGAGMAGNLLFGGIIGAGVDAGTGAMHSHKPNPLVVELEPAGAD